MGQKVNPHGLRVGVIKNWDSRWFTSDEKFGDTLVSDYKTGLCTVDENSYSLAIALDFDLRNACSLERILQIFSDIVVGYECVTELFVRYEPSRVPILNYAHAQTVGIYLLTH